MYFGEGNQKAPHEWSWVQIAFCMSATHSKNKLKQTLYKLKMHKLITGVKEDTSKHKHQEILYFCWYKWKLVITQEPYTMDITKQAL